MNETITARRDTRDTLQTWTVYDHPADYPGLFVARLFIDGRVTSTALFASSLEEIRAKLPRGLYPLPRSPADSPSIVETWL